MKKSLKKATITKKACVAACAVCPGSQASLAASPFLPVCTVANVAL